MEVLEEENNGNVVLEVEEENIEMWWWRRRSKPIQSNLYITALCVAVTLYIAVTLPFPKGDRCTQVSLYKCATFYVFLLLLRSWHELVLFRLRKIVQ